MDSTGWRSHDDGIASNFVFDAYDEALPAWRYPDLTHQTEYLGHIIRTCIEQDMRKEAGYLRCLQQARAGVKEWLEGPNTDIDRIVRSVHDSGGRVSHSLRKQFPQLADALLAERIVAAIQCAFVAVSMDDGGNVPGGATEMH